MLEYDSSKALISIHIPKTGGKSFRNILRHWFKDRLLLHYFDEINNKAPSKYELMPGYCIHGHFNQNRLFGIENYYPSAKQFITFLRDPFDILVSRFKYAKENEIKGISFRDGQKLILPESINEYLEMEMYNDSYHPNILHYFPTRLTKENFKFVIDHYFIFIGDFNNYQLSVTTLASKLGFSPVPALEENKSFLSVYADPHLRKEFEERHVLEYEVYKYAIEKFKLN